MKIYCCFVTLKALFFEKIGKSVLSNGRSKQKSFPHHTQGMEATGNERKRKKEQEEGLQKRFQPGKVVDVDDEHGCVVRPSTSAGLTQYSPRILVTDVSLKTSGWKIRPETMIWKIC